MEISHRHWLSIWSALSVFFVVLLMGCATGGPGTLPPANYSGKTNYIIAPGDTLAVFVWGSPELSMVGVPVRPDGRITTPLAEDVRASGKTPSEFARELEQKLSRYVKRPKVTVTVSEFIGQYNEQIRVVGEATVPQSLPYREGITALDVLIAVGGLTPFANGNKAKLIRNVEGKNKAYRLRLRDLINDGDISANVDMAPGDILIIPEASWF